MDYDPLITTLVACIVVLGISLPVAIIFALRMHRRNQMQVYAFEESESRFMAIFQKSPVIMAVTSFADGTFIEVNETFEKIIGFSREEVLGKTSLGLGLFHADDREKLLLAAKNHGPDYTLELAFNKKNGEIMSGLISVITINYKNQLCLITTVKDITDYKKALETARHSEEKFVLSFHSCPSAMVITRQKDDTILDVNESFLEIFGFAREHVIGRTVAEMNIWLDISQREDLVRQLIEKGVVKNFENRTRDKNGDIHWGLTSAVLIDIGGESCILTQSNDITEHKLIEEERFELQRCLLHSQKMESLGMLAGGIAHDFNNLLAAILGNTELAMTELKEDSPLMDCIRHAFTAASRAADLVKQMLAYCGKGNFVLEPTDLNELVQDNAEMMHAAIGRDVTFTQSLTPDLPPVFADPSQIQQVIMNLITNASEAMEGHQGAVDLSTGVDCYTETLLAKSRLEEKPDPGSYVWLEVTDTGCGMSPETTDKLFEPFFTTKFMGRGLGMAAIHGIVRAHNGAIMVDSSPEKGTKVRVLFPLADNTVDKTPEKTHWEKAGNISELAADEQLTVLVVDDEEIVRNLAADMLQRLGFNVLTAEDGREAVNIIRENDNIACVLLDYMMPTMDGIQTLGELRKVRPNIKIILSSGFSEQDTQQKLQEQLPSGFIQKPYMFKGLREVFNNVLKKEMHH